MSRMSELHADLGTIHQILLGQRKVASTLFKRTGGAVTEVECQARLDCIDELLLEMEAAGVVWPDNIVSITP